MVVLVNIVLIGMAPIGRKLAIDSKGYGLKFQLEHTFFQMVKIRKNHIVTSLLLFFFIQQKFM